MNAGVIRSKFKKADLEKAIKLYKDSALPAIATHRGAKSATLLVNRETGDALSIAFYENESAAQAFGPKAQQLVGELTQYLADPAPAKRELYEVATSTQSEAKAVVERTIKAINAHDLEAAARDSAPDSVLSAPGDMTVKGPQAIKEFNRNWITAFPDAKIETQIIFAQGNQVAIKAQFVGTHKGTLKTPVGDIPATDRKLRGDFLEIFEVDRGLIKNSHLMFDQVQLMTQLGMAPTPPQQQQQPARTTTR